MNAALTLLDLEIEALDAAEFLSEFDALLTGDSMPVWYSHDEEGEPVSCIPRYRCTYCREPLRQLHDCKPCAEKIAEYIDQVCAKAPKGCIAPQRCGRGEPCRDRCSTWSNWS